MTLPSFDNVKTVGVLAVVALVGYVGWRAYKTGAGAVESVSATLSDIGDAVSSAAGAAGRVVDSVAHPVGDSAPDESTQYDEMGNVIGYYGMDSRIAADPQRYAPDAVQYSIKGTA